MRYILESARLKLREFTVDDAPFIVELLNSPGWLRFIGDRNVRNEHQARSYLQNGPILSYRDHGFGLYLVQTRNPQSDVGMCGLLKRDTLENPDIGFAFLPQYTGKGYAFEIAKATLEYSRQTLQVNTISAITDPENEKSRRLLENLGMKLQKQFYLEKQGRELLLYNLSAEIVKH